MKYLLFALCFCSAIFAQDANVDAQLAAHASSVLKANLRDPDSLKISRIALYRRPTKGQVVSLICIDFNAKNGFGGYNGTDIASLLVLPQKERFLIGDFEAVDMCKSFDREVKKGKATYQDITALSPAQ